MGVFPVTTLEVGDPSVFHVKTVLYKTNESSTTLFENMVFYVNNFCVGDFTDCEVSGVNSSAFAVAVEKISAVSTAKKVFEIPLGSNFDNYVVKVRRQKAMVYITVINSVSANKLTEEFAFAFEYFKYVCTSYYRMVAEMKSLVKDSLI